jgi:hypothetical protein
LSLIGAVEILVWTKVHYARVIAFNTVETMNGAASSTAEIPGSGHQAGSLEEEPAKWTASLAFSPWLGACWSSGGS